MTHAATEPNSDNSKAGLVLHFGKSILFVTVALCLAGAFAGLTMPSSVFPQTNFPRVVILIDNGVIPGDEMMATITRPVEEAMKDIPGTINIRSTTGRGSAAINVFFNWSTNMEEAEQYVLGRLAQIRNTLPNTANVQVHRLTFSAFPILGISLTSETRSKSDLWEAARYDVYPRFLRIEGVARINLVGGRVPEYHVVVDPARLDANHLTFSQITQALADTNQFTPAGMHEENYQLYLAVVDNRLHNPREIEDVVVAWVNQAPVRIRDVAIVRRGEAPQFNRITADGKDAVLLNIYGQPGCNTVKIADDLERELQRLRLDLSPDMKMAFFYDQSQFVREGVRSVWEAILLGLALSVIVLFVFLRSVSATIVAALVIPVTILLTLIGLRLLGMSFNLMTLGGIAAVVGIVIDDAIVVVEAIYAKILAGLSSADAVKLALQEVGPALVGSTMTPVVVFVPLAFLDGVAGVFFRALAVTMVIALLISLVLAVTWTPVTAGMLIRTRRGRSQDELEQGGPILRRLIAVYAWAMHGMLRVPVVSAIGMACVAAAGLWLYTQLESDFLPAQDEGAFVIDYYSRPGTSLTETNRMLMHIEQILNDTPEVESFSRRTGARLALALAEPNTGDFLVKLKQARSRSTEQVIEELRAKSNAAEPALNFEFPGVLGDLIGDLTWSPRPVEIKIFSTHRGDWVAVRVAAVVPGGNSGVLLPAGPHAGPRHRPPTNGEAHRGSIIMKSSVEVRRPSTQAVAKIGGLRHAGLGRPTYMPSLALATYLLLVGCTDSSSNNDVATESARQPVPVQVAQVELTTLRPELDLVGTMIALPEQTAMVSPQVGGWVEKLAVVEGQTVSAGDLLVQLDARAARTDVERATAILAEKESAVHRLQRGYLPQEIETERQDRDKARAAVDGLRGELVALDELLKRREISPVAYETKAKALTAAEAALASADAHLQLLQQGTAAELIDEAQALRDVAKADLEHAQLLLEWCSITSPIDGVVVQLSAHQGQFFDRAVPLATVVDMSNLFVQLRISSRKFSAVRLETPVIVQLDSFPGREFHGHVARISGQADPMTGNVVVFALVENDDHMLRPGLNCQARVSLPAIPDALAIPLAAVADNSGTPVVTCIRESKAYETEVELGVEDGDLVQVIHGLALGDTVATSGGYGLPPGTPIEVSPKTASE